MKAPAKPDYFVRRARLHGLLDEVVRAPVTLVVAPAGAGKTSLLSGWVAELDAPTCWLTLGETDRDVAQLWTDVSEALESVAPGCSRRARPLLRRPEGVVVAVEELTDGLEAGLTTSTILVLDDAHLIVGDEVAGSSLASFLQDLPSRLHVVLASRLAPKLPVDRLRARGRLGEVHFAELRFAPREAAELLSQLVPWMPADDVTATSARAEGWAAGLQLSALAARAAHAGAGPDLPTLGADLLIHDYVWREVLAHEDPALVQVLQDVAVVERVGPGLAEALTDRPDAGRLLLDAESRGLFVSRLGADGWFQVHALVRAALLNELARSSPGRISEHHARAARWFEAADEVVLALEHWLLANEPRRALRLLAASEARLSETGREATIRRTIAAIPVDAATADLEAMLDYAWCHLLVSRRRFAELVEQMTWWAEHGVTDAALQTRVTILRSVAATVSGDWQLGGELAREALGTLGDLWWRDPLGRYGWNVVARKVALTESWDDSSDAIREAELVLGRDPLRRAAFEGTRALGGALAGRPVDALRVAAGVRGSVGAIDSMTILRAELSVAEAVAHREMGDRSRALAELEALATAPGEVMPYCRLLAVVEMTQARLDDGDLVAATRWFARAGALVEEESIGADGRAWLARVGTRMSIAAGDLDSARRWAGQVDDGFWGAVSDARVQLALGERGAALESLERAELRCPRHEVVLLLVLAQAADDREKSLKTVTQAVELAASHGMLQTVVSEGPDLIQLVERAAWRAPGPWMERLRRASVGAGTKDLEAAPESLTERERDVLRFLPSRLSLGEIASELYISQNTLKFHLKVIYRKLGVSSRAEAAEAARLTAACGRSRG